MKVLVTGIDGFVGGHLARLLLAEKDVRVFGTTFLPVKNHKLLQDAGVHLRQVDLVNEEAVSDLINEIRPDELYHLAAQSFVPSSFEDPWKTLKNNIHAQLNILQTVYMSQLKTKVLVVGSSEEYGAVTSVDLPIAETCPLRPTSPYSVSKVAQDMLGFQYATSKSVAAIRVRPFNHIGPGQARQFVASAFASQIAAIENDDRPPVMVVGNLTPQRDISDVRDVIRAYVLLLRRGTVGEVYNVGSDRAVSIELILNTLLGMTNQKIEVKTDPGLVRPVDIPLIICDSRKLRAETGWQPIYSLDQTLADILDDWRTRVRFGAA